MSCCNNTPRRVNYIINCNPDCPDVQDWVFSNANVEGQGVFYQQDGTSVEFYGLMNTDGYLTVTLDSTNKAISIDLDSALIAGSIPDATTTVKGKVELATDAEAQAKTDTAKALTPSNLAAITASTTATGLVELATSPETVTGTDTQRATTPAGVKAALDATKAIQVVADATARGAATPTYVGQQLYQTDTKSTYFGTSLAAGGWEGPLLRTGANTIASNTTLDLTAGSITVTDSIGAVGKLVVGTGATLEIANKLDFSTGGKLLVGGVVVPSNSVLITSGNDGQMIYTELSGFLGLHSDSEEYTLSAPGSRTLSPSSTLEEVIQVLTALIADLMLMKRPISPP